MRKFTDEEKVKRREAGRRYYKKNREAIAKRNAEFKLKNKDKLKLRYDKERNAKYALKRNFGISMEDYKNKLQKQDGVCAICYQPDTDRNLCVDHCHQTGKIRDLLCRKCNSVLGYFKEDIDRFISAIAYLRKWNEN